MKSYEERQAKWVKKHNLKVGDKVKVLRAFENCENGCEMNYNEPYMRDCIGRDLEVFLITDISIGIYKQDKSSYWYWPYFVLEPVKGNADQKPKKLKVSIERAKEWYNSGNEALKAIALEVYEEGELEEVEKDSDKWPTSWSSIEKIDGFFIDSDSEIWSHCPWVVDKDNHNLFATEQLAEAALAVAQLSQLIKAYNGDWVADWTENEEKYIINVTIDNSNGCFELAKYDFTTIISYSFLAFDTKEKRDHFMEHHEELILQAAPIICRA